MTLPIGWTVSIWWVLKNQKTDLTLFLTGVLEAPQIWGGGGGFENCLSYCWTAYSMIMKLGTHKGNKMVKKYCPYWLTFFADVIKNTECTSIFAKIPTILQTNLKESNNKLFIILFRNPISLSFKICYRYLVIISTKVPIKRLAKFFKILKMNVFSTLKAWHLTPEPHTHCSWNLAHIIAQIKS